MRVTFREALPAWFRVQRGGSGGLNQTVCHSAALSASFGGNWIWVSRAIPGFGLGLGLGFCMCTYSVHAFTISMGPHILIKFTERVQDKDDQTVSQDIKKSKANQSSCDQAAGFVCNRRARENKNHKSTLFSCTNDQKHSQKYLLLIHLYDQIPPNVCF